MNARQKAKKYKRMYEKLLNQPVKFNMEQSNIRTLKFERFYPKALVVDEYSSYFRKVIAKDIAYDIASKLEKYIDYNIEFCPHVNSYRFSGKIKIVENGGMKE